MMLLLLLSMLKMKRKWKKDRHWFTNSLILIVGQHNWLQTSQTKESCWAAWIRIRNCYSGQLWVSLPAATGWAISVSASCSCVLGASWLWAQTYRPSVNAVIKTIHKVEAEAETQAPGELHDIACKSEITSLLLLLLLWSLLLAISLYNNNIYYNVRANKSTWNEWPSWKLQRSWEWDLGQNSSFGKLSSKLVSSLLEERILQQHWVASLTVQERRLKRNRRSWSDERVIGSRDWERKRDWERER